MKPGDQSTVYHSANYFGRPIRRLVDQFVDQSTNRWVNNRLLSVIVPTYHWLVASWTNSWLPFFSFSGTQLFSFYWICCTFHNNKPILGLSTTFNWKDFVRFFHWHCLSNINLILLTSSVILTTYLHVYAWKYWSVVKGTSSIHIQ